MDAARVLSGVRSGWLLPLPACPGQCADVVVAVELDQFEPIRKTRHVTKTGVVLGVSGQIGTAVARRIIAEGWPLRGLHQPCAPPPGGLAAGQGWVRDR